MSGLYDKGIVAVAENGRPQMIDFINPATGRTHCNGNTLEQVKERYPGEVCSVMGFEDYRKLQADFWRIAPHPITKKEFIEAIEVLPPEQWVTTPDTESFAMCEYWTANITSMYCRIGRNCYHLKDEIMPHNKIVALVKATIAKEKEVKDVEN